MMQNTNKINFIYSINLFSVCENNSVYEHTQVSVSEYEHEKIIKCNTKEDAKIICSFLGENDFKKCYAVLQNNSLCGFIYKDSSDWILKSKNGRIDRFEYKNEAIEEAKKTWGTISCKRLK